MAGIIKVDQVQSDSNLAFNIAGSNVAFIDASALRMVGSSITANGTTIVSGGKIVSSAQPAGAVLQVIQTTKSDVFTTTSTSYTDVTGLSVSITPTSATSKILVFGTIIISNTGDMAAMQLVRGSTPIQVGIAASNRYAATADFRASADAAVSGAIPLNFLDSPSTTSSTTYKIQVSSRMSGTTRVNASGDDADQTNRGRFMSTITVMEIAA